MHFFHFLTQEKIGFKLSEIMVGSGIREKPIPDPGVKKVPDPGSATLYFMFVTLHFPGWLVHGGGGGGYIVNQAILAWSFASRFFLWWWIYSESSNIGLVVCQ